MNTDAEAVIAQLRSIADPSRKPGIARVGITVDRALGVSIPTLRRVAVAHRADHELALGLWATEIHEARILASMIDDPRRVTRAQMEDWAADFDSWDLCDQVCQNLFRRTPRAYEKAVEWTTRDELFVKRAGFALMAGLVVADKRADDARFAALLEPLAAGADDDRDLVRKGASWALRSIGKRSAALNELAIRTALELAGRTGRGARWVGADALRELRSPTVQARLGARDTGPTEAGGTHA